uniref:Uncharacterized protein n=1 Tax=Arundo donax TaxID=35708 RepID=A0A0A9A9Q0_ARUDO
MPINVHVCIQKTNCIKKISMTN